MGLKRVLQVLIIGFVGAVLAAVFGLAQNVASTKADWGPLQFINDRPWPVIGAGILLSSILYLIQHQLGSSDTSKPPSSGGHSVDMRGANIHAANFVQGGDATQAVVETVPTPISSADPTGVTDRKPRVPVVLSICSEFLIDEPQWEAEAQRIVLELNPEVRCVRLDEENLEDAQKVADASLVVLFCKASRFGASKAWLRRKLRFVRDRHQSVKVVLVVAGRSDVPVIVDDCASVLKLAGENVGLVLEETEEAYINKFSDHAATAIRASSDQQFLRSLRSSSSSNSENSNEWR